MAFQGAETLIVCRQRLKETLDGCFARRDDLDPRKRFARRGVTREIFDKDRLEHFLQLLCRDRIDALHWVDPASLQSLTKKIRGSEDSPRCCNNVLAILLYSQCKDQTLLDFIQRLLHERPLNPTYDCDLPLERSTAREAFGNVDGHNFWEHQFLFCPVILKEQDEVRYVDHKQSCPRPFLEEPKKIGQGAYAVVYRVRIEKGHLINDKGANDRNEYAMKEFIGYDAEAKKSFEAEGTTLKQFIQAVKSHRNIATTKASLEWGNTYSLFFDLAKHNLWEYFMRNADAVRTLEEKRKVFSRSIGLASALAYLHEELYLATTNEQLQCYHLDLKPQNILVFEESGDDIWKISDFGISRIKRIPPNEPHIDSEHHVSFLDRLFQSKESDQDLSSGVNNSRYGGTYAAPEAKEKSDTVTRKSDGIADFQESRAKDRSNDWFFNSKALKAGSQTKKILHVSVSNWLDTLNREASRRNKSEAEATKMATELLRKEMFLKDQESRMSAKNVEKKLIFIQSHFTESLANPPEPITSSRSDRLSKLLPWPRHLEGNRKPTKPQKSWRYDIPEAFKRCKFSADGKYLCTASNVVMAIESISDIQQQQRSTTLQSPKDKEWADFSLGSKYLCAAIDSEYFEFSYLPLSTEEHVARCDRVTSVKCRIRKVVISPNDQITAFLLEDSQQGVKSLRLALYRTHDLLGLPTSSKASVKTHESSSSLRSSTTATSLGDLPWKDITRRPQDSVLPFGAQLADLKFSSNSNILMGITEPFNRQESPGMQYEVITWDVMSGQRFSPFGRGTTGYDDMGESWAIDTFAVFAPQPSFATISKKKIRIGIYDPPEYRTESRPMSNDLLDVLLPDKKDVIILVGRSDRKAQIVALPVSTNNIKGLESLGGGFSTGSSHYNQTTDCCCLSEREDKMVIMVANINPGRQKGTLYETFLE